MKTVRPSPGVTHVLAPCYTPDAATGTMKNTFAADRGRVALVLNVNSGPLWFADSRRLLALDPAHMRIVAEAQRVGHRWLGYIDLMAGNGYSPVPVANGSGRVRVEEAPKRRWKTAAELRFERSTWMRYGQCWGFFLDDFSEETPSELLTELATWPEHIVLNPGKAMPAPKALPKATIIVSETAGSWPRPLTKWERTNRSRCGVIGLKMSLGSVPKSKEAAAGFAWLWASPSDDLWAEGQSQAYFTATPKAHLEALLKP